MKYDRDCDPQPKIYISGPISGRNISDAKEEFHHWETELSQIGFCSQNPFNNGLPEESNWASHMRADIKILMSCDYILMLPGWWHSRGAWIERLLALALGIKVIPRSWANLSQRERKHTDVKHNIISTN